MYCRDGAAIAGFAAVNRTQRRLAGIYWHSLLSVLASSALVTGVSMVVIIFMIAAGSALGIFDVVLLAYYRLLSPEHQLRLDYLEKARR